MERWTATESAQTLIVFEVMDASLFDVVKTMRRNTHRMSEEEQLDMIKVGISTRPGYDHCLLLWCAL